MASESAKATSATARSIARFLRPTGDAIRARPGAVTDITIASSLAVHDRSGIAPAEDGRPPVVGRRSSSRRELWPRDRPGTVTRENSTQPVGCCAGRKLSTRSARNRNEGDDRHAHCNLDPGRLLARRSRLVADALAPLAAPDRTPDLPVRAPPRARWQRQGNPRRALRTR